MNKRSMTRAWTIAAVCAVCAVCALTAHAADALTPVALPADFGVHAIGSVEPVVYTELSGELRNPVDRKVIEAQCEVARKQGRTDKTPLFEAGDDKPYKTESKRFTNAKHWANYTVDHVYTCDRADGKPSGADGLCGCTYRVVPKYRAQIKNKTSAGLEVIDIDGNKRTAQRRLVPGHAAVGLERGEADVAGLAPAIVGKDVVAGIPCVMHRRSMGGKNHMDICITDDPEKRLPPEMRFRALSEYMPNPDGKGAHRWSKADKVVLNGAVDAAVFSIPEGFTVKEFK